MSGERETDELRARLAQAETERDSAQEHVRYHLADFRPGADMAATGDLAVDMAHYAGRLKERMERAESVIAALLPAPAPDDAEGKG